MLNFNSFSQTDTTQQSNGIWLSREHGFMVVHELIEKDRLDSLDVIKTSMIDSLKAHLVIKDSIDVLQNSRIQNSDSINAILHEKIDITNDIAEQYQKQGKVYKKQRNVAVLVGFVFLILSIVK